MSFRDDLKFGNECEREIAEFISKGKEISYAKGNFKYWDYIIDKKSYEQKSDRLCYQTGNIIIELLEDDNPKGILTSKADYWVSYPIGLGEIAVVPRLKMMKIARDYHTKSIACGDRKAGLCLVLPWKSIPDKYKITYAKCLI